MNRLQEFQKTHSDVCPACGNSMLLLGNSNRELHYKCYKCLQCEEPFMRRDDNKPRDAAYYYDELSDSSKQLLENFGYGDMPVSVISSDDMPF